MFDPHMCMGFNLLTLTSIGFDLKLLIETRIILLLGKQYYTLNGSNHLFLNLPRCVFLIWETIKHNFRIGTSSQYFSIDST